ncbi:MAG: hypothetical protein AAGB13_18875 [Cyanobacteria bacterium P01_F01_bin.33]
MILIAAVPIAPLAVGAVGFIAAVGLGSIAWYNSKRPAGWENAERPNYVPKVDDPNDQGKRILNEKR